MTNDSSCRQSHERAYITSPQIKLEADRQISAVTITLPCGATRKMHAKEFVELAARVQETAKWIGGVDDKKSF